MALATLLVMVLYYFYGPNTYFDGFSALISIVLMLILVLPFYLADRRLQSCVAIICLLLASTILPGLISLIAIPDLVSTPLPLIGVNHVNAGLIYLVAGMLAFFLGLLVVGRFGTNTEASRFGLPEFSSDLNIKAMVTLCTLSLFIALAARLPFFLGISQYQGGETTPSLSNVVLQSILIIFDPEVSVILSVYYILKSKFTARSVYLIVTIGVIYLGFSMYGGSRSGLFRFFFIIFVVMLSVEATFKFHFLKLISVVVAIVISALLVFQFGTQARVDRVLAEVTSVDARDITRINIQQAIPNPLPVELVSRLATYFFYSIQATVHDVNEVERQRIFSFEFTFKNVINNLPGTLYPEAKINTSRLFGVVYRGTSADEVLKSGYFSEFYTAWGLVYLFYGPALGLAIIAVLGAFVGWLFLWVDKSKDKHPSLQLWALYAVPGSVLFTQGIDHTIWILVVSILRFSILGYIFRYFMREFTAGDTGLPGKLRQ